MAAVRIFNLALGVTHKSNGLLGLGIWNLVWRHVNIVSNYSEKLDDDDDDDDNNNNNL
jgi:hypothetical protein